MWLTTGVEIGYWALMRQFPGRVSGLSTPVDAADAGSTHRLRTETEETGDWFTRLVLCCRALASHCCNVDAKIEELLEPASRKAAEYLHIHPVSRFFRLFLNFFHLLPPFLNFFFFFSFFFFCVPFLCDGAVSIVTNIVWRVTHSPRTHSTSHSMVLLPSLFDAHHHHPSLTPYPPPSIIHTRPLVMRTIRPRFPSLSTFTVNRARVRLSLFFFSFIGYVMLY